MTTLGFTIEPAPPYDHDLTAAHLTFTKGRYAADAFEAGRYRRLLDLDGRMVCIDVTWNRDREAPRLDVRATGEGLAKRHVPVIEGRVRWLLGAGQNLAPFYRMALADDGLAPLVRGFHGLHMPQSPTVFESLISAILGQQVSSAVARILRDLVTQTYGTEVGAGNGALYSFPSPAVLAAVSVDDLRAIKFSRRKAEYVIGAAGEVVSGALDLEGLRAHSDEEIVARLCEIRGVGAWTAHWLLIQAFDRVDGFPHGDLALQRFVTSIVHGPEAAAKSATRMTADQILEHSRRWAPHRSFVTTYLFAAARSGFM